MTEDRVNFIDVEDQREIKPLPRGRYVAEITDVEERFASDSAKNPGARMQNFEFTVADNPRNGDYKNQKVWDLVTLVPSYLSRVKAILTACQFEYLESLYFVPSTEEVMYTDSDGDDVALDFNDLVGTMVEVQVSVRKGNDQYPDSNDIKALYPYEANDYDLMP